MIDPNTIKPAKHGKSDKYSWNLYKYLTDENFYRGTEIYFDQERKALIIGSKVEDGGWVHGCELIRVLCNGNRVTFLAYPPATVKRFAKVSGFWEKYQAIGRCAIDSDHSGLFVESEGRFVETEKTRTCQWCGKVQYKHIKRKVVEEIHWKDEE